MSVGVPLEGRSRGTWPVPTDGLSLGWSDPGTAPVTPSEVAHALRAPSAHGLPDQRGYPYLVGRSQLHEREGEPTEGIALAHFIVSDDIERSWRFYFGVPRPRLPDVLNKMSVAMPMAT